MELTQPMIRPSLEVLSRINKYMERALDKELAAMCKEIDALRKRGATPQQIAAFSQRCLTALNTLKKEIVDAKAHQDKHTTHLEARIEFLTATESSVSKQISERRIHMLVVDFLLRQGCYNTALILAEEAAIKELVDIDVFTAAKKVEDDLNAHSCRAALKWCSENKAKLKKLKDCDFEFRIRVQQFVQLLAEDKPLEAIGHAQQYFAAHHDSTTTGSQQPALDTSLTTEVMALLAFYKNPQSPVYKKYFAASRWDELKQMFRMWNLQLYALAPHAMLSVLTQAGIITLKTNCCGTSDGANVQCPVCFAPTHILAKDQPVAHQRSRLVCRITGEVMDDQNPPVVFPNGRLYSAKGVEKLALEHGGAFVTCPATNEVFQLADIRKCFIA